MGRSQNAYINSRVAVKGDESAMEEKSYAAVP